jgi:hypothetical protein
MMSSIGLPTLLDLTFDCSFKTAAFFTKTLIVMRSLESISFTSDAASDIASEWL